METAPRPSAGRPGVPVFVCAGLVAVPTLLATFAGDGSGFDGVWVVGGVAVGLLLAFLVGSSLGLLALPRIGRSGAVLVCAAALLVAWTGITVVWSIAPDRSWEAFNKSAAFLAFLGLGIFVAAAGRRAAARLGAAILALVTAAVLVWALAAKSIPALDDAGGRVARLQEPVGYWNALALLADMALALALWLGAANGRPMLLRIPGALLAYAATLTVLLTISRTGLVVALGVVALWLLLSRERVEGGLLLAAAAVPAALVAGWAFTRPALVEDGAERADRVADGAVLGVMTLAGAAIVASLVVLGGRRGLDHGRRRRAGRALLGTVAAGGAISLVALIVAIGNPVAWFEDEVAGPSCAEVVNDPSRLGSLNLNNRWCWWTEARDVFAANSPEGAGAGTFEIARKRYRTDIRNVLEPHSVPLQLLAGGGIAALALFLAVVGAATWVCVCAVRQLDGGERAAAVALVAAPAAYLAHALVDYTWDFLAATGPMLLALGVLAGAGGGAVERRRQPIVAVASVLLALALLVSFASPRLAERSVRASTRALDDNDFETARDRALWARFLNPLSVEPVFALARIAERQGFPVTAERRYVQAVELQPENPSTWYELGIFELQVRRNMCAAYEFLNDAYTLDPAGSQWTEGGALDVAREAVNAGACER